MILSIFIVLAIIGCWVGLLQYFYGSPFDEDEL